MNVCTAILFFLLLTSVCEESGARRKTYRNKKVSNFEYFGNCDGRQYPNFVNNSRIVNLKYLKGIEADLHIVEKEIRRLGGRFESRKCQTIGDKNCELFMRGNLDMCKIFVDEGQFYSKTFKNEIHPRLKCPVKQGVYRVRNATMGVEHLLAMIPVMTDEFYDCHWNLKLEMFDHNKPDTILCCVVMIFKLETVKSYK